jgi:hypothetical protein
VAELGYTKFLSGSTNGRQIKVAATSTPGTLIHQTPLVAGGLSVMDQVFLYATNTHASTTAIITIEFGGVTDPDDLITYTVDAAIGPVLVVPGFILNNNLVIRAFADAANIVNITGYAYRLPISQTGMSKLQ